MPEPAAQPALLESTSETSPETGLSSTTGHEANAAGVRTRRRPALSPSRASDFKQCPLLYRFRAIDRLPETPSRAQIVGTVVHGALERLFGLPAGQRDQQRARDLLKPSWQQVLEQQPEAEELFRDEKADGESENAGSAAEQAFRVLYRAATKLLDSYFTLEDPSKLEPEACELQVETELESGLPLRGFIDRVDVASGGQIRLVDYKTGSAPRQVGEAKALFQMKFYALMIWRQRGVIPHRLLLMYLADRQSLAYTPDEAELRRFEKTLDAIWQAIGRAKNTQDFRPSPSKLCNWCDHKAVCPSFGGTPPPYPEG